MIVMITAKIPSENAPKGSGVAFGLATTLRVRTLACLFRDYNKLRLIGFHHSMRFPDVLKAKHSGWLRPKSACRHLFGDGLKRNVRERKLRHEAAEEGQTDAACHLQERG